MEKNLRGRRIHLQSHWRSNDQASAEKEHSPYLRYATSAVRLAKNSLFPVDFVAFTPAFSSSHIHKAFHWNRAHPSRQWVSGHCCLSLGRAGSLALALQPKEWVLFLASLVRAQSISKTRCLQKHDLAKQICIIDKTSKYLLFGN